MDTLIETYITNISVNTSGDSPQNGEETYVVGVTGDLPPLDYVAADGTPAGFNVALMDAIAEAKTRPLPLSRWMRMPACPH